MPPDPSSQPQTVAVEQLEALGLSAYAARTFVALSSLGKATAQEVSEVSDVPRTRVYDAVEELQERGLVDVQQSSPKQFWVVSAETASRRFEQEYTHRVEVLTEALDAIEPAVRTEEQRGVWTVTGHDAITDRLLEFIESATDEIVFMTVEALLTEEIVTRLQAASERGVSVRLAGLSAAVEDDIREAVPAAEPFESLWVWSETPAGRLLMVDEEKTLVSVLVEGSGEPPPNRVTRPRSGGRARRTASWWCCGRCSRGNSTRTRTTEAVHERRLKYPYSIHPDAHKKALSDGVFSLPRRRATGALGIGSAAPTLRSSTREASA